jgi:hypothetical protein
VRRQLRVEIGALVVLSAWRSRAAKLRVMWLEQPAHPNSLSFCATFAPLPGRNEHGHVFATDVCNCYIRV